MRISGLPDLSRSASDCRPVARTKKLLTVDQGLPARCATVVMHCKHVKKAIIIPFSTSVISRQVVFLFVRDGSGGMKFCLLVPCFFGRPTMLQLLCCRSRSILSCYYGHGRGEYYRRDDDNATLRGRRPITIYSTARAVGASERPVQTSHQDFK